MCFADSADGSGGEVLSFQRDYINAAGSCGESFCEHEGWNVLEDAREAADEGVAADRCEVVHSDATAEGCVMFDADVSAEHHIVGGNYTIFDDAIVSDMACRHKIAVVTDRGNAEVFFGSAVDGNCFAKDIAVADNDLGWRALIGEVLRFPSDDASWVEFVISTDGGMTGEGDAIFEACSTSDTNVWPDHAVVPDAYILIEFCSRIYYGGVSDDR